MFYTAIKGYHSSTGSVCDYIVYSGTYNDYLDLCRKSIKTIDYTLENLNVTDPDRIQALNELKESYQKTLNGEQPARAKSDREPGYRYLTNCIAVYKKEIVPPRQKRYRNNVTMYKDIYRKALPISDYIGTLKISSEKCDFYKDIEDPSDFKF